MISPGPEAKPDGVLIVDKPSGATSHDIVAQARRIFRTRDVGHAGTLDPMATGVLLLLFGEATKLSGFLTRNGKRYRATVALGRATNTLDADGETTEVVALPEAGVSSSAIEAALYAELARELQVPPAVSAIKVDGQRSYALARAGEAPELAPRAVHLAALTLLGRTESTLTVELSASKGYYVRAFARDVGVHLGLPAHLTELRRLASGQFELTRACSWPAPPETALIATAEAARLTLPVAELTETGERRARLGQPLVEADFSVRPSTAANENEAEAWFGAEGRLIALGHERAPGDFRVQRGFRLPVA